MSRAAAINRSVDLDDETAAAISYSQFEQLREARSVIKHEAETLAELANRLDTDFCRAVDMLFNITGRAVISGIGKAGLIGQKIVATFASTGTRAQFLHPTEALHGDLGCLSGDDVLLALSNSGETQEVCDVVAATRRRKIPCIAITANDQSRLGSIADIVIRLGSIRETGPIGLAPTASTTAMLAIGDALAMVLCRMRGFTQQQFALLHPGGTLGQKLRLVHEVMRRGSQLRIAPQSATIREVFTAKSSSNRRTGAVMLVDEESRLAGIFTDSDLARLLERHLDDQWDLPISHVMTKTPLTIDGDSLLSQAVELLSARKISELPVVDEDNRPIGMIDITDIIGLVPHDGAERSGSGT